MIKNKKIIITGASSGIGEDMLKMLAPHNKILAVARNVEKMYQHENVISEAIDISIEDNIDKMFKIAFEKLKDIDIVFANAGFAYYERISAGDWKHIDDIFKTNVYSAIYIATKLKEIKKKMPFRVVITASAMSFHAMPGYTLYSATKFALKGFVDAYRYELLKGQHVQIACPVATYTNFFNVAGTEKMPWPRQKSEVVARKIIKGAEKKKRYIFPAFVFKFSLFLNRFFPVLNLFNIKEKKKFLNEFPLETNNKES
ncbi:MAG: SDR family NAD(P)-dependent oxidoreductase [Bacteroidales bacterium]